MRQDTGEMGAQNPQRRAAGVRDFDPHGMVGIRLLGASDANAAAVKHQLGPIDGSLERER